IHITCICMKSCTISDASSYTSRHNPCRHPVPYTTLFRSESGGPCPPRTDPRGLSVSRGDERRVATAAARRVGAVREQRGGRSGQDRKSTRLNSSHLGSSYAVFWLKKKRPAITL